MPRVMIVEDDLTILSNLSQLLQLSGLDVVEAHDGCHALELLRECRAGNTGLPKIIVSDLMMPNMDGFELLETIKDDPVFQEIPFVLLSARSEASDLHQAFTLGASDYLVKPFEMEQLMDVIRYLMSNQSASSDALAGDDDRKADNDFFLE